MEVNTSFSFRQTTGSVVERADGMSLLGSRPANERAFSSLPDPSSFRQLFQRHYRWFDGEVVGVPVLIRHFYDRMEC